MGEIKAREMICKWCNSVVEPTVIPKLTGPHAAELRCPECNTFLGWQKKEKNEDKRTKSRHTPESLKIDYCQICQRKRSELAPRQTLEIHHIKEIVADCGDDEPYNILVLCTMCHKEVHLKRTYLHKHYLDTEGGAI